MRCIEGVEVYVQSIQHSVTGLILSQPASRGWLEACSCSSRSGHEMGVGSDGGVRDWAQLSVPTGG
jgi:hypothetical protein